MNTQKLKSILILNGYTQEMLAKKLGISAQALCAKINNKGTEFKQSEIQHIIKLFKLTEKEINQIFFDNLVS